MESKELESFGLSTNTAPIGMQREKDMAGALEKAMTKQCWPGDRVTGTFQQKKKLPSGRGNKDKLTGASRKVLIAFDHRIGSILWRLLVVLLGKVPFSLLFIPDFLGVMRVTEPDSLAMENEIFPAGLERLKGD